MQCSAAREQARFLYGNDGGEVVGAVKIVLGGMSNVRTTCTPANSWLSSSSPTIWPFLQSGVPTLVVMVIISALRVGA